MSSLQELVNRLRFVLSNAPKRGEVFKNINGKNSSKDIARNTGRALGSVLNDIKIFRDVELVTIKEKNGIQVTKDGAAVFEKSPLVKHIPKSYFQDVFDTKELIPKELPNNKKCVKIGKIPTPSSQEILDIAREGENHLYEFKQPGVLPEKICDEITGFLHTRLGGILFYGIDDPGNIVGSDMTRQVFDQRIQNSIRSNINPPPHVDIVSKDVLGYKIILIKVPPWNRKNVYQCKDRYLIRKGSNNFVPKPPELEALHKGQYID